jgi:predicted enzyme related to lactoylglutathione lyase
MTPRPMHFEIHAADTARARRFYEGLFGWKFDQWPGGAQEYWLITTGPMDEAGGINGGMLKRVGAEPLEGQPVNAFPCTIGPVADVEATVHKAVSLGGSVAMPKQPIPGIGWLAYVKDTEGNIIGVMQNDPAAK